MKRNVVAWAALIVSTAALVSSQGLTRSVPAAPRMPLESQKTARALSDAFVAVADFVRPSVVQISAQRTVANNLRVPGNRRGNPVPPGNGNIDPRDMNNNPLFRDMLKRFFDEQGIKPEQQQFGLAEGTGSGFVYDDQGHILTNNHVVNGASKITVTFHDGVEASAKVVGTDPKTDVAVIKVEMSGYPALPRGMSDKLRVGELVMAVGSPFGLSQSVTLGIVSATDRNDLGINRTGPNLDSFESFIQTDAPINPGNSGGPLVDTSGRVVGINSAIMSGGRGGFGGGGNDGVGFAIPIDMAQNVADMLIKKGKVDRARIGIVLQQLNPVMASSFGVDPKQKGVLVGSVLDDSPAEKAGLKRGDVIVSFNDKPVVSMQAFRNKVSSSEIGKPYSLKYFRGGKERSAEVVLGDAEKYRFDEEKQAENAPEAKPELKPEAANGESLNDFGLEVQPLTAELAKGMGLKDTQGVLISSVKEGSPAEAAELKPGMVITEVMSDKQSHPVASVKEFQNLTGKQNDVVLYVRSREGRGWYQNLSKTNKN